MLFQFLLVRLRDLPTGRLFNFSSTFQFLLVRLRAICRKKTMGGIEPISIPSGAIKREYEKLKESILTEFQFLLVRLRADP